MQSYGTLYNVGDFIDKTYTLGDHLSRENDSYALFKYEETLNSFQELGVTSKDKILNIGCGAADFNLYALKENIIVDGFDSDEDAIKLARKRLPKDNRIVSCQIENAKENFDKYKFLACHDVLEHLENADQALIEIKSSLVQKNGYIIFSVPAHSWLFGLHDEKLGHYRRYSKKSFTKTLNPHFEIINMHYVGLLGVPIVLLFSRILRKPYPSNNSRNVIKIIEVFFKLEKLLRFPYGTSIIALAKNTQN